MIKHLTLLGTALLFSSQILLAQWKPAGDKIRTFWAEKVDVNNVLPEYPRPIMERSGTFGLAESEWAMELCRITFRTICSDYV